MISNLSHILMGVSDVEACSELYRRLDLRLVASGTSPGGVPLVVMSVGHHGIELYEDKMAGPYIDLSTDEPKTSMMNNVSWVNHFSLHTRDANISYEKLLSKGFPFLSPPSDQPSGHHGTRRRLLEFTDPDLLLVQMAQLIDEIGDSAEPTGLDLATLGWPDDPCDRIDHIALRSTNLQSKREFYCEKLGLPETVCRKTRLGEESTIVAGDTILELLWTSTTSASLVRGTITGLAFNTEDIDLAYRTLHEKGVQVSAPAEEVPLPKIRRRVINLNDPDGLPIKIVQRS